MDTHSTPQLSYQLKVTDASGKTLLQKSQTRPEVCQADLSELKTDAYHCTLTVSDVFGQTVCAEYSTKACLEQVGSEQGGSVNDTLVKEPNVMGTNDILWIAALAILVICIAGAGTVVLVKVRNKK